MDADLMGMSTTESDYAVTLTLSGHAESLRPRLVEAVERLGYKVITEQPLYAKRAARGYARWDCSFETLDYPRKLTIALKPVNDLTTLATFNYEIKAFSCMTRGDRQTLQCEAEALAALTMQRSMVNSCAACGTEVTDDSRFCRRCGAVLDVEVSELEVLRLTESARKAHHNIVSGVIVLLVALTLPFLLIWIDTTKAFRAIILLSSLTGAAGLFTLLQGMWQLHHTLNPAQTKKINAEPVKTFAAPQTRSLPPRPAQLSVTEGTTELLRPEEEKHIPVAVERKAVDTAEVK
jgi:hypothetical protein